MDSTTLPPAPKLTAVEQVSDGWINKYLLTFRLSDGSDYTYEAASRRSLADFRCRMEERASGIPTPPDAVCIVPRTDEGELLLIREFRYPLNSWCISFPAGLVENGEDLEEAIDRELREETGYALVRDDRPAVRQLPQPGFSSTGLTDEAVAVVFARVQKAQDARPEHGELIEPFLLRETDVAGFVESNTLPMGTRAQLILQLFCR